MDRIPLDIKTLRFANILLEGVVFPPIKVQEMNPGQYRIRDGRHRWTAYRLVGRKTIRIHFGKR